METTEPSGRLKPWRLRLGELGFRFEYKKGIKNYQADDLLKLSNLGGTTIPTEEEMPCSQLYG